jgi:GxxExxY protein
MEKIPSAPSAPRHFGGPYSSFEYPHRDVTDAVLGAAIEVHRRLGPGFLESCYEEALCLEFEARRISYERQLTVRVRYREAVVAKHLLDLVVSRKVVVEIKAVRDVDDTHLAVCRAYLKATGLAVGLIVNFSSGKIRCRRVVNTAQCGIAEGPKVRDAEGFDGPGSEPASADSAANVDVSRS